VGSANDRANISACTLSEHEAILVSMCPDAIALFHEVGRDPSNPGARFWDGCNLERFGLVEREQFLTTTDGGFGVEALFAFVALVQLEAQGGAHPLERALLRIMAGG
jgi:hypothetical protein